MSKQIFLLFTVILFTVCSESAFATIHLSENVQNFSNTETGQFSAPQTFSFSANNLHNNSSVVIVAPTHYQVSFSESTGYSGSIQLTTANGSISGTTIYLRFAPQADGLLTGSVTITGSGPGNGNNNNKDFNVSGTSLASQPSMASTFTVAVPQGNAVTLNLNPGNGGQRIIIARQGNTAPAAVPVDGNSYSFNTNYNAAPGLGDGKVVYVGTDTSIKINGLSGATTYSFSLYEFNPGTASFTTNYFTAAPSFMSAFTGTVLAIRISDFTAELKDDQVYLNWETLTEESGEWMELQSSTDGRDFYTVDRFYCDGSPKRYSSQVAMNEKISYYRIAGNHSNGSTTYSKAIKMETGATGRRINCYPTRVEQTLYIRADEEIRYQIISLNGTLIKNGVMAPGILEINTSGLTPGGYIVNCVTKDAGTQSSFRIFK